MGELPIVPMVFVGPPDMYVSNLDVSDVTQLRNQLAASVCRHWALVHVYNRNGQWFTSTAGLELVLSSCDLIPLLPGIVGVYMFSSCLHGASPDTPASARSQSKENAFGWQDNWRFESDLLRCERERLSSSQRQLGQALAPGNPVKGRGVDNGCMDIVLSAPRSVILYCQWISWY